MKQLYRLWMCALLLIINSGCTRLDILRIDGVDYIRQNQLVKVNEYFPGIRDALERSEKVRLITLHGMGTYTLPVINEGHSEAMMQRLVNELQLEETGTERYTFLFEDGVDYGVVRTQDYIYDQGWRQSELTLYELTWTTVTMPIKDYYLGYDWKPELNPYKQHRMLLNDYLRDMVIAKGLSDAVMYSGGLRDDMRHPLVRLIEIVMQRSREENRDDEIVMISQSLGSYMVFDTLQHLRDTQSGVEMAEAFESKFTLFFMLANQIPLLYLSQLEEPLKRPSLRGLSSQAIHSATAVDPSMEDMQEIMRQYSQSTTPLDQETEQFLIMTPLEDYKARRKFVAFNDPNDLLSFTIPDWVAEIVAESRTDCINVILSNADTGYVVFARPDIAHLGYDSNPQVIQLIANGYSDPNSLQRLEKK